jgi:iron complex outermembrane receptor protein
MVKEPKRIVAGSVALLLVLAGPAVPSDSSGDVAEPEADPGPRESDLQEYVEVGGTHLPTSNTIATKLPIPLQVTPFNIGKVSATLFQEQEAVLLGDSLVNVSGVNVQTQVGVHDFFMIRGFSSVDGGLILTDGAAELQATNLPLYNVAGVEVLKGPGGFLYGSDPLAGAVNVVRKQPLPTNFAVLGATLGSFSTTEARVDWNLANGSGERNFRLNAFWRDSDNYRDDKESSHLAINPSFTLQLSGASRINLNLEYVEARYAPDSGLPLVDNEIPEVPRERSYQTPFDYSDQEIARFQLDYENRLNESVTLRNKLYYRDLDWQSNGTQLLNTFIVGDDVRVSRTVTTLDNQQDYLGNQFEAVFSFDTGPVTHSLLTGLEVAVKTDDFSIGNVPAAESLDPDAPPLPSIPSISVFDPVETAVEVPALPFLVGSSDQRIVAPYVVDQMKLSPRVHLSLGARYDVISREDDRSLFVAFPPLTEGVSRDDGELSPMLGIVFAPTTALSLYANAGGAFAPASPRVFGDLAPEESTQYELGVKKGFLGSAIRTTFALYQIDRENIPFPDDNGVTQQSGDQRSRGFEIEVAAEPLPRLRTFLSYAYNDSELMRFSESMVPGVPGVPGIDRSGNRPAFTPENLLNLWVSRSFRSGLGVAGGARFIDEQFISEDNTFTIDSALVFDATVSYDLEQWRLRLNFKNLTDEDYELRGFGPFSVIPADPRSVYLGIDYRL